MRSKKFKLEFTFEARKQEAQRITKKFPDRLPIICERANNNSGVPEIDKKKYLVPIDLTISQFLFVIRKRMELSPEKALFIFVNGTIPSSSATISQVYSQHKDLDGFLYISYSGENVFG